MNEYLQQIQQLPVSEQLLLVEQIWDGLHDNADVIQEWHRNEGKRRLVELESNYSGAINKDEMWSQVDKFLNE